jgi:hypothetical protein
MTNDEARMTNDDSHAAVGDSKVDIGHSTCRTNSLASDWFFRFATLYHATRRTRTQAHAPHGITDADFPL